MEDSPFKSLRELSAAERIQLAQDLWDSVAEESGQLELTDEVRAELDRRLAAYEAAPDEGASWETVKLRLLDAI